MYFSWIVRWSSIIIFMILNSLCSLIIAAPDVDAWSIIKELLPLLSYSAPFVIYHQYIQVTCFKNFILFIWVIMNQYCVRNHSFFFARLFACFDPYRIVVQNNTCSVVFTIFWRKKMLVLFVFKKKRKNRRYVRLCPRQLERWLDGNVDHSFD